MVAVDPGERPLRHVAFSVVDQVFDRVLHDGADALRLQLLLIVGLAKNCFEDSNKYVLPRTDSVHNHLSADTFYIKLLSLDHAFATRIDRVQKQIFKLGLLPTISRLFI